jgi:hypothetical protein
MLFRKKRITPWGAALTPFGNDVAGAFIAGCFQHSNEGAGHRNEAHNGY